MVSVGFFFLELNMHTLWRLSLHSAKCMQYHTLDSSVYVHSDLHMEETFINLCNSTTSKNGNGQRSARKLGPFKTNMGELCSRDGYWKKSSKRRGRHTSFGNRQGMSANIQKPANVNRGTSRHTKILERLTNNFEPKQNIIYQRYMFNSCTQEQGEKFDAYLIKLRHLIKMCEYSALEDELLHDRIITGTSNNNVRARLLSKFGLTLDRAIDICRRTKQAEQQLSKLNNLAETIYYTKADKKKAWEFIKDCKFCGQSHDKGKCQTYELTCAICLKRKHIARVCKSQVQPTPPQRPNKSSTQRTAKVLYVETEAVSSDESIYALRSLSDRKHYHVDVRLSTPGDSTKIMCKFQIDTGASCSTLAFADYKCITKSPP